MPSVEPEYSVSHRGGEVEIACPHCGGAIKVVIERTDEGAGRRLLPQTQQDMREIEALKGRVT